MTIFGKSLGEKHFLVHREDDDLDGRIFFQEMEAVRLKDSV